MKLQFFIEIPDDEILAMADEIQEKRMVENAEWDLTVQQQLNKLLESKSGSVEVRECGG